VSDQDASPTAQLEAEIEAQRDHLAETVDQLAHKLDVIKGHCDTVGRDFAEIEATLTARADDLDTFVAQMEDYAKLGIKTVMIVPPTGTPSRWIEEFVAPAVQRVADL